LLVVVPDEMPAQALPALLSVVARVYAPIVPPVTVAYDVLLPVP
jgi:hypothetical protein